MFRHAAYPGGRQDDLWREANVGMARTHRSSHPLPQVKYALIDNPAETLRLASS